MATLAENAAKVVAAHGALKEALAAKGVAVPEGVKLSGMPALVRGICTTPNAPAVSFFEQPITEFPAGPVVVDWSAAKSLNYCFYGCTSLAALALPDGFGSAAESLIYCFEDCSSLAALTLPDGFGGVATDLTECFYGCASLAELNLPDGFGAAALNADACFGRCFALKNITGAIRFPVSFDLSGCTKLTHDSLMNVVDGLVEVEGKTLRLGTDNLAKLTDEEKAIATGKGWTLA